MKLMPKYSLFCTFILAMVAFFQLGSGPTIVLSSDTVPTRTPTSTSTITPTEVPTKTETSTPTASPTADLTNTPTIAPKPTDIAPPSVIIWKLFLPSIRKKPLPPTPTPTSTFTPTSSPTATSTSTQIPTATNTSIPPTATATPAPPTATPIPPPTATPTAASCAPNYCASDSCNCGDFNTQAEAQALHDLCLARTGRDIHRLDQDGNRIACESLPRQITFEKISLNLVVKYLENESK